MKNNFICLLLLLIQSTQTFSQLQINEIMQSNVDCIIDDLNEFPDSWVELYNVGSNSENLGKYSIAITDNNEVAWHLPDSVIEPKSSILLFCDKVGSGLHTDFKLESGKGCCLYLFFNNQLIDKIENLKKQPAPNIAYGRENDEHQWGYMLNATPGWSNKGVKTVERDHILGDPIFDYTGRVFTMKESKEVIISKPQDAPDESIIVFTIDGSEPTRENGTIFETPIIINRTTIIKAKILCDGWLSPRSISHSYIFHNRDLTLPVISLSTDDKFINDSKLGIYVEGDYQEGVANYLHDWRRPVQMEFFETAETPSSINQLCEFRIAGASTRVLPLKTMNIYANKRFGTKRFSYVFFPDQKPGISEFKSLVLRNSGSRGEFYSTYIRDALVQRSMGQNADLDYQAYRPAILYVNGEYKGLINIRERTDEDYIYSNYDGLEDVDVIENHTKLEDGLFINHTKLVEGSSDNIQAFKSFYTQAGHTLEEYEKWMDWREYINLVVMNLYFCNLDWFGNNNIMWRAHEEGRWRWIAKDTGYSSGLTGKGYDYDIFKWLYYNKYYDSSYWGANSEEATMLFRHMMDDEDFRREFIDRLCIYMGDFLNENGIRVFLDKMYNTIKGELSYHKMLYMPEQATAKEVADVMVSDDFDILKDWLHFRTNIFYQQIGDFYDLGRAIPLHIIGTKEFNGVSLRNTTFDGHFFAGRRVKLTNNEVIDGKSIRGWIIEKELSGVIDRDYIEGSSVNIEMPNCDSVAIKSVLEKLTDINITDNDGNYTVEQKRNTVVISNVSNGNEISIYNSQGICLFSTNSPNKVIDIVIPSKGLYILKIGKQYRKLLYN